MDKRLVSQSVLGILFGLLIIEIIMISPERMGSVEDLTVPRSETDLQPAQADQTIQGVHLIETREGEKEWELWADQATGTKGQANWDLEKVKMIFYGESGLKFTVNGNKGSVVVAKKNVKVEGDVKTRSSNGYRYLTEMVEYDSDKRRLMSPGNIQLEGPKSQSGQSLHLSGIGMESDLKSGMILVKSNVKAKQVIKKNKVADISSNTAEFSGKSHYAKFSGDTIIDMEGVRITGPEAELVYDKKQRQVTTMVVEGGVKVSDFDKWATSKKVKVHFGQEKYVFQGDPRVIQNNDELRGDEIVFLQGGKTVKINRVEAKVKRQKTGELT